jgi:hypothetical protein
LKDAMWTAAATVIFLIGSGSVLAIPELIKGNKQLASEVFCIGTLIGLGITIIIGAVLGFPK